MKESWKQENRAFCLHECRLWHVALNLARFAQSREISPKWSTLELFRLRAQFGSDTCLKRCFAGLKGFGWTLCERPITGSRRECRTETEMPRLFEYLRNFKH
jgi:hypothetical protein